MNRKTINRPFAPEILRKARALVTAYHITLWMEGSHYWGRCIELDCLGDGKTPDTCVKSTREAATALVAYMLEQGEKPPIASREGARTQQVNVRLSTEEKAAILSQAHRWGFKGISDYMRAAAISSRQPIPA